MLIGIISYWYFLSMVAEVRTKLVLLGRYTESVNQEVDIVRAIPPPFWAHPVPNFQMSKNRVFAAFGMSMIWTSLVVGLAALAYRWDAYRIWIDPPASRMVALGIVVASAVAIAGQLAMTMQLGRAVPATRKGRRQLLAIAASALIVAAMGGGLSVLTRRRGVEQPRFGGRLDGIIADAEREANRKVYEERKRRGKDSRALSVRDIAVNGYFNELIEQLHFAISAEPTSHRFHDKLVKVYGRLKMYSQAREVLVNALAKSPNDPRFRVRLDAMGRRKGRSTVV